MSSPAAPNQSMPGNEHDEALAALCAVEAHEGDSADYDLDQVLYCSLLNVKLDEDEIAALANMAANLNRMDHITGLLMQADGVFVQLIEGPRQAIDHLWARLLRDKRHRAVVQLYHRREVEERACVGWDMRYVKKEDLLALIHEAKEEATAGRKSAWTPAIERMDFLLSHASWDSFVQDLKKNA